MPRIDIQKIQDDGRIFVDMKTSEDNPCLHCGLCCSNFRVSFYFGEISSLHGSVPDDMTSKVNDFYACMKGTEQGRDRCIALKGDHDAGTIRCAIYDNRPTPCREYPVWLKDGSVNPKCNELRKKNGLSMVSKAYDCQF